MIIVDKSASSILTLSEDWLFNLSLAIAHLFGAFEFFASSVKSQCKRYSFLRQAEPLYGPSPYMHGGNGPDN